MKYDGAPWKRFAKRILRPVANAMVDLSGALPTRITDALDQELTARLQGCDRRYVTATFNPMAGNQDTHVLSNASDCISVNDGTGLPLPPESYLRGDSQERFLNTGRENCSRMRRMFEDAGTPFLANDRILDFGCGPGRMIRWLYDIAPQCEVWGVDVHEASIKWLQRHFTPPFSFCTSTTHPHLPFEDNYFDHIYAGSVFTHIYDLTDAWLLELRRILRPGGRLYLTAHDNETIRIWLDEYPDTEVAAQLRRLDKATKVLSSDFAMFAVDRRSPDGWRLQVFHDRDYLCSHLKAYYTLLAVAPRNYGFQTAFLVEKKRNSRIS